MKSILFLFLFSTTSCFAQKATQNPNIPYENFTKAYEELNADLIEKLYLKNATIFNLYDSSDPNSIRGLSNIKDYFLKIFQKCEENGQKLQFTFKITNRERIEDAIQDNGYYKIVIVTPDKPNTVRFGKFSIILELENEMWRFSADANTNTDSIDYENAIVGSIPQPGHKR